MTSLINLLLKVNMLKALPIGISSLEEIKNNNYVYVDKTKFVKDLASRGKYYFLSRPRRFGKSLFLDALKQAFLGNQALFKGLYLEHGWDWSVKHPVIHISFASGELSRSEELDKKINDILNEIASNHDIILKNELISSRFKDLIVKLFNKYSRQVVILIDEYDKPILDNITDIELSNHMRSGLRNLYSVIKDCDPYLKFVFLTGISRFVKTGIFSGLNNLDDLTLHSSFSNICGYNTEEDLNTYFNGYLCDVDRTELKRWYNGYNFMGTDAQKVYNPFAILLFLGNNKHFANYWFSNSTPAYLIKLFKKHQYTLPNCENLTVSSNILDNFDPEDLKIETILFQTGYLTIKELVKNPFMNFYDYRLSYPNFEVRQSLNSDVFNSLTVSSDLANNTDFHGKILTKK